MASALIGSLRIALGLDTAQFEEGANKARARAKSLSSDLTNSFNGAKRAVEGLFAAFTVGLLTEQIKKSLDYAGSLAEVSRTLGLTTKDLQTFRFAASQSGVAQDQLEVGLRRLSVSMGKAELGSKAQAKAFQAIGISVDELKGKNTGDVFRLMADGLSKVTDHSQRAAIEMTLMGRSGSMLDNLLAPGSQRLNELADAAQRLGIVLSDAQIQGAEETAHKLAAVKEVLAAQIAGVVANNANAILSLSSALAQLTGQIVRFLGSNPQLALGIIGALLGGRVGGLPGAVAGGIAGALAGGKLQQISEDSNTDLAFRSQKLRDALARYKNSQGGPDSAVLPGVGVDVGSNAAKQEVIKQTNLLRQATAQFNAAHAPLPKGTNAPAFLAGGGGGGGGRTRTPKDKNEADTFQFDQEMRQQDIQILEAKKQLSHDIGQQAEIALQILDLQTQAKDAEIDHKVAQAAVDLAAGKITQATYDQIKAEEGIAKQKNQELAGLQRKAILDERDDQLLRESIDLDSHGYDIQKGLLQKQADLAQTAEERRTIELKLLDLQYNEQRIMLERIASESKNVDEVNRANMDLAALSKNYALDRQNILQQTRGPLQQYLDSLPTTSAKWTEALQNVAVDGFGAITNAADTLAGKIVKVGGIFGDVTRTIIADLLKIELQKMIIAPLVNALGGLLGGSSGALSFSGITNYSSSFGGSLGSAVGLAHFANGGSMVLGGIPGTDRNTLALNGVPIARTTYGEVASFGGKDGGGGRKSVVEVVLRDEMLDARITEGSSVTIARAYPAIKAGVQQSIIDRNRRR